MPDDDAPAGEHAHEAEATPQKPTDPDWIVTEKVTEGVRDKVFGRKPAGEPA